MRRLFDYCLLFCFLITGGSVWAQKVSQDEAIQRASRFLTQPTSANGMRKAPRKAPRMVAAETNDCYYIFNDEANGGFVIVSGEERTPDILGYSDGGLFDPQNVPINMRAWLNGYAEQIKAVAGLPYYAYEGSSAVSYKPIAPLLKTQWDQSYPYNLYCPKIGGVECLTGCVATVMAQIMKYWEYPSETQAPILNQTDPSLNFQHAAIPVGTKLDWANMLQQYTVYRGVDSEAQQEAVAKLMLYCGLAVKMKYGIDASGANVSNMMSALQQQFGYSTDMKAVFRDNYINQQGNGYEDWLYILYNELRQGRPLNYNSMISNEGHSYLIDGYGEEDFFHIDWGWGGRDNGYYRMWIPNPSDYKIEKTSFDGHYAVIGIEPSNLQPDTKVIAVKEMSSPKDSYSRVSASVDFADVSIVTKTFVTSVGSVNIDYGLGLYQGTQLLKVLCQKTVSKSVGEYWEDTMTFSFGGSLADGTYQIVPICKQHADTQWQKDYDAEHVNAVAIVSGNTLSLSVGCLPNVKRTAKLTCLSTPVVEGTYEDLTFCNGTFQIRNDGDDYEGALILTEEAYNSVDDTTYCYKDNQLPLYVAAGETKTVTIPWLVSGNGAPIHHYCLNYWIDDRKIEGSEFSVSARPALQYNISIAEADEQNVIHGDDISVVFRAEMQPGVICPEYNGTVNFYLAYADKAQMVTEGKPVNVKVSPGQPFETTVTFHKWGLYASDESIKNDVFSVGFSSGTNAWWQKNSIRENRYTFADDSNPDEVKYDIVAFAYPRYGGTIAGYGTYIENSTVTLVAQPNEGYEFVCWKNNNDEVVCTEATYVFTVTAYTVLRAYFQKKTEPETEPLKPFNTSTAYYIYNEAAGLYLCGDNMYDTQASVGEAGPDLYFEDIATDGQVYYVNNVQAASYAIETHYYNSQTDHYLGMVDDNVQAFMDQPSMNWLFVPQEDGSYLLSSDSEGHYLCYKEGTKVLGFTTDATDVNARWHILTREDIIARAADATPEKPFNMSSFISYADFGRNGKMRYQVWQGDITRGGYNDNWCAEKFNCTFDVYQVLTGMPNGAYMVTCQAFYREGADQSWSPAPAVELHRNGQEHLYAHLYANDQEQPVKSIFEGAGLFANVGVSTEFGNIPNSMSDAANWFNYGMDNHDRNYYINTLNVNVTDGTLRLGIRKSDSVDRDWTCFDSFRLYYLGDGTIVGASSVDNNIQTYDVYTTTGLKVRHQVTTLKGLPKGIYVVNGRKVVVK